MKQRDRDRLRSVRTAGIYTMIPMILLAAPLVGYAIGWALVRWLHTGDWLKVVMTALGMVAGGREVFLLLKKAGETDRSNEK